MAPSKSELTTWLTGMEVGALPRYLGVRFTADGTFRRVPGNTVIRHVARPSASMDLLISIQERLKQSPYAEHFAFLPPDSFHMTVFEGVIDDRRLPNYWPLAVPIDAPVQAVTDHYLQLLAGFEASEPFAMRIDGVSPLGLKMIGATEADEQIARALRDRLAVPFGYRSPQHDSYMFHVTFAYVRAWLPETAIAFYYDLCSELSALAADAAPLQLNAAAFCSFETLTRFEELLVLPAQG